MSLCVDAKGHLNRGDILSEIVQGRICDWLILASDAHVETVFPLTARAAPTWVPTCLNLFSSPSRSLSLLCFLPFFFSTSGLTIIADNIGPTIFKPTRYSDPYDNHPNPTITNPTITNPTTTNPTHAFAVHWLGPAAMSRRSTGEMRPPPRSSLRG